jgi:protein TonB
MSQVKYSLLKALSFSLLLGSFASLQASATEAFDVRPTPVKTPPPEYPNNLKREGVSGMVAVKADIDETGAVINCSVSKSSNTGFNEAAITAVKTWKFKPAQKDGAPVKISLVIPIKFNYEES